MTQEPFEAALRKFLQQEPFQPFVIELADGRTVRVEQPRVGFGGGSGGYVTPDEDLVFFECQEVRDIRVATQQVPS